MTKSKKGKKDSEVQTDLHSEQKPHLLDGQAPQLDSGVNNQKSVMRRIINNVQYIKDLSFESPNAPMSLRPSNEQPRIEVTVNINVQRLQGDTFEVALQTVVSAKAQEKTTFLVDLTYAGVFTLEEMPEHEKEPVLLVYCPSLLFPFVRRVVADVTRDGGFPPLMVDPIDFASLYQTRKGQKEVA